MIALSELQELSLNEKFSMMETLWESIALDEEQIAVPQWHKDILEERDQLIKQGKAHYIDWEIAKNQIQRAIA